MHGVVFVYLVYYLIASIGFMSDLIAQDKKYLAIYPVFLFYFFLSWLVLVSEFNASTNISPASVTPAPPSAY